MPKNRPAKTRLRRIADNIENIGMGTAKLNKFNKIRKIAQMGVKSFTIDQSSWPITVSVNNACMSRPPRRGFVCLYEIIRDIDAPVTRCYWGPVEHTTPIRSNINTLERH